MPSTAWADWMPVPEKGYREMSDRRISGFRYTYGGKNHGPVQIYFLKRKFLFEDLLPWELRARHHMRVTLRGSKAALFQLDFITEDFSDLEAGEMRLTSGDFRPGDTVEFRIDEGEMLVQRQGSAEIVVPSPWLERFRDHSRVVVRTGDGAPVRASVYAEPRSVQDNAAFAGAGASMDTSPMADVKTIAIFNFEAGDSSSAVRAGDFQERLTTAIRTRFPDVGIIERQDLFHVDLEQKLFGGTLTGASVYFHGFAGRDGAVTIYAYRPAQDDRRIWNLGSPEEIERIVSQLNTGDIPTDDSLIRLNESTISILPFRSASKDETGRRIASLYEDLIEMNLATRGVAVERQRLGLLSRELLTGSDLAIDIARAGWLLGGWVSKADNDGVRLHLRLISSRTGEVVAQESFDVPVSIAGDLIEAPMERLLAGSAISPGISKGPVLGLSSHAEALEQYMFALNELNEDRRSEAIAALDAALAIDPKFGLARYRLFLLQAEDGRVDEADATFETLSRDFPGYPELDEALLVAADQLYSANPARDAERVAEMLGRFSEPRFRESRWMSVALVARALLLERFEKFSDAHTAFTKVNSLSRSWKWFYHHYQDEFQEYAAIRAKSLGERLGIKVSSSSPEEATLARVEAALLGNPSLFQAWYHVGRMRNRRLGQNTRAAEAFRKALAIRPDYAECWKELWLTGNDAGALEKALSLRPDYPLYLHDAARFREAVKNRMHPHDFYASLALYTDISNKLRSGYSRENRKTHGDDLKLLLELQPARNEYRRLAGDFFLSAGESDVAAIHFRFIAENDPFSADAENAVAQVQRIMASSGRLPEFIRWHRFLSEGRELMVDADRAALDGDVPNAAAKLRMVITEHDETLLAREALIQWIELSRGSDFARDELRGFVTSNSSLLRSNPYWREDPERLCILLGSLFGRDPLPCEPQPADGRSMRLAESLERAYASPGGESDLPLYHVSRAEAPPVIDGILESEWLEHRVTIAWQRTDPYPRSELKPTEFFLSYGDSMLYFAFRCREFPNRPIMGYQSDSGSPIYFEDGVVLQLDPYRTMHGYREIRFNPLGVLRTVMRGPFWPYNGFPWQPEIEYKTTLSEDGWVVEAQLSVAGDYPAIKPGTAWKINPARIWFDADLVMIAPTSLGTDIADPENFSMVIFD